MPLTTASRRVAAVPDGANAVRIEGLHKRFGDQVALESLDLEVAAGEFLVLLGPSGCGKTTTMRSIAGLERPTNGRISIGGRVVFDDGAKVDVAPSERNVGMVFQSYAIWPHRTVAQNISFPLKMQKVPRKEQNERVERALHLVGLEGLGGRSASMLSGGQMQRVALARSIVMRPSVLLLDEPLSNLDAKLRERLRVELKETQQELGTTSVYVTHDQAEALALADRIVLMRKGVIEQVATPLELYQQPATRFAAEFVGMNNVLPGTSTAGRITIGDTIVLVTDGRAPDGRVSVCLRAEDFMLEPPTSWNGNRIAGTVEVVNLLGSQVLYAVHAGGVQLEVVVPFTGSLLPRGQEVELGIAPANVRCFATDEAGEA